MARMTGQMICGFIGLWSILQCTARYVQNVPNNLPIELIETGDICDCKKPLDFAVDVPVVPQEPDNRVDQQFHVEAPQDKVPDVPQVYGFEVEVPLKPAPPPLRDHGYSIQRPDQPAPDPDKLILDFEVLVPKPPPGDVLGVHDARIDRLVVPRRCNCDTGCSKK